MGIYGEVLNGVRRLLPKNVQSTLAGTPVATIYRHARSYALENIQFSSPVGDFALYVPPGSTIHNVKKGSNNDYEPGFISDFSEKIDSTAVFYDIGTRFGFVTMVARKAGVPPEQIYGFEAARSEYRIYKKNHQSAGVNCNLGRVGDREQELRIDDFVKENQCPTVVKIDVEGGELQVLKGMRTVLSEARPTVYCEVHPGRIFGGSLDDVIKLLEDTGFSLKACDHFSAGEQWGPVEEMSRESGFMIRASPS
jgi:hypothetical protein